MNKVMCNKLIVKSNNFVKDCATSFRSLLIDIDYQRPLPKSDKRRNFSYLTVATTISKLKAINV